MAKTVGITDDGYVVEEPYRLRFFLLCFGSFAFSLDRMLGFGVECNRNAKGKRRPYYMAWIFGLHVTGGWLFDDESRGESGPLVAKLWGMWLGRGLSAGHRCYTCSAPCRTAGGHNCPKVWQREFCTNKRCSNYVPF